MAILRNRAPAGVIKTQLRPGKTDYKPWINVNHPHGSGRFVKKSIIKIDPENSAPKLITNTTNPTKRTKDVIKQAIEESNQAMKRAREEDEAASSTAATSVLVGEDGFTTVTGNKRKDRSSPGNTNQPKKIRGNEVENSIVLNLYREMGLENFA